MAAPAPPPDRPLQFRAGRSFVHRRSAGCKILVATATSGLALAQGSLPVLMALVCLVVAGYRAAGLSVSELWKDARWLLVQGGIVVLLTLLLRGQEALTDGCRAALQLALVFLPFGLMIRTTGTEALIEPLRGWLPPRLGFALGATLRFVPVLTRELGELVEMQRLRGARLHAHELWRPRALRDWVSCVALPMTVRAIEVAQAAADAAEIRGVGGVGSGSHAAASEEAP